MTNGKRPETITVETKTCPRCGIEKFWEEFPRNRARKTGLESYCKECIRARRQDKIEAEGIEAVRAKEREYMRTYRANNYDVQARERGQRNAYNAALMVLREMYRDEFDRLYALAKQGKLAVPPTGKRHPRVNYTQTNNQES